MVSASSWLAGCVLVAPMVAGHGFLTSPTIRGRFHGKFRYEPQSLGAVGPGGDITICGRGGAINFHNDDVVTELPAPGEKFKIQAHITAHHYGHMIVRMCQFIDSGTSHRDLKTKCIRLKSARDGKDVWPLSAATGIKEWEIILPTKQQLARLGGNGYKGVFTMQWRWNTGNSCRPSEEVENEGSNCNEFKCCSEVFTNCADVVFKGLPYNPPKPPVDPPKPQPVPAPSPAGGGSGGCIREDDIKKNPWANDDKLIGWCANFGADECDTHQQCVWDGSSGGSDGGKPEPEPEEEPHTPHRMSPTQKALDVGLKFVKEFCAKNKKYFCDHENPATLGSELCDCSPVDPDEESEPESESEPDSADEDVVVTDPSQCNGFKNWCQKACSTRVATNQCWGQSPVTAICKCKNGVDKTNKFPGLLQIDEEEFGTKFSDHITRHVGVHGDISP